MAEESSSERLLVASGVQKEKTPLEELLEVREQINSSVEKLMTRSDRAVLSAQETQRTTEEMFQRLQKYCNEKVPAQMVKALDDIARDGFQKSLMPLHESVAKAAHDIDRCRQTLTRWSWDWRLVLGAGATMLATLVIGGGLIYYLFSSERIAEMKRLAMWGQKLEARYQASSPKERERLDQWFKGGKL